MGSTSYLNLFTYNVSDDGDIGFDELRVNINGSGSSSNMNIFDAFAGQLLINVPNLLSGYSASDVLISASVSSASAQVEASGSQIEDTSTRFEIIDTFSGAGQADFTGISQDYSHLLIMGRASTVKPTFISNVGIDFNGDSTSSNYYNNQWNRSGSSSSSESVETFTSGSTCVLIGNVSGDVSGCSTTLYAGSIYAIIPNYSGSSAFYKTGMGISSLSQDVWRDTSLSSGAWLATDPINRIRVFGVNSSGSRYDFVDGTEITLYGIE
jgi:hypothetical protein